jgi:hypothetical protein
VENLEPLRRELDQGRSPVGRVLGSRDVTPHSETVEVRRHRGGGHTEMLGDLVRGGWLLVVKSAVEAELVRVQA